VNTTPKVLVVAATARELIADADTLALVCGVGPVEAAATTAAALARRVPSIVLHIGLAGARRHSDLRPPALVIGREARYCDLVCDWAPRVVSPPQALVAAAQRALPEARLASIGTSARVGGTSGCEVEAMEGFAVLRAAALAGVPAIEIRAVSNEIEEDDRSRWRFEEALAALAVAVPRILAEMRAPNGF